MTTEGDTGVLYGEVHILDIPYHLDKPYTYALGDTAAREGSFVLVPFGLSNVKVMGLVTAVKTADALPRGLSPSRCKTVLRAVSDEYTLGADTLGLCRYMKEMTFCTIGDAANTVIPIGALKLLVEKYEIVPDAAERFHKRYDGYGDCPERQIFDYIAGNGSVRPDALRRKFGADYAECAERMRKVGFLRRYGDIAERKSTAEVSLFRCLIGAEEIARLRADDPAVRKNHKGVKPADPRWQTLLAYLLQTGGEAVELPRFLENTGLTAPFVRSAVRAGLLSEETEIRYRNPYLEQCHRPPTDANVLNAEQQAACDKITALFRTGEPKAALLHGVTGSGKTRVIKAVMDNVLAAGRQVIMLIPEIALTPQSVAIFCSYYGERVAVVHSELTPAERLDVWQKAKKGLVDIVIGTRSAIFTPLPRLGMIVIDEEQEHTYKSDRSPKYHARDIARYRCAESDALMLLASATPSFESYYKAEKGVYTLVELNSRYGNAKLPQVVMADLHEEPLPANETPLGHVLSGALEKTVANGNQAVLFINRRGYRKYMLCLSCRETVRCPHCSVPLTVHYPRLSRGTENAPAAVLVCHYCGYRTVPPRVCPACGAEHLLALGCGTQRAEDMLITRYPGFRVLRMDADTTQGRDDHERILGQFRRREADVLLGTQMVTKGHDFPDVTLVGVLSADALLYADDFRASEKAFSLLTQVIGRAGRGEKPGLAVIQTYSPDNEILRLAAMQDYKTFYRSAIRLRQSLVFPPFCDMVLILLSAPDESEVNAAAAKLAARLSALCGTGGEYADVPLSVFGPFEARIYKLEDRFRMRFVIKCRFTKRTRALFAAVMTEADEKFGGRVSVSIDVNPDSV